MKTKKINLKKSFTVIVTICAMLLLSTVTIGQTYYVVDWDEHNAYEEVPYCSSYSHIKCAPPEGVTTIEWAPSLSMIGDTLVLESGFNGQVTCFYDGGQKDLYLRPLSTPISPLFEDIEVCVLTTTLDAGNYNQYGFTSYSWSNGASSQTVTVGPGTYTVNISNLCGSVNDDVVITYNNPNRPDLYEDQEFCYGETGTLDPHVSGPVSTLWSTGATTNELIVGESGTYSVYVLDENGCDGRDTINVTVNTPVDIQMHDVSFDTTTNKNMLRWCVELGSEITHVRGEVKNDFAEWIEIETVPYEQGYIIHWESMPQADYNEYRLVAISECGEGNPSSSHKSIWLTQLNEELQWENYYGNFTPTYYVIFARMINNTITQLGTVAASPLGYLNHYPITANPNITKYFVAFEHNCGSKDVVQYTFSNYYDPFSGITTKDIISFDIFPNPAADQLNISINNSTFEVQILTPLGQVVLTESNVKTLDVSNLASGLYIISVSADGVTTNQRFVKQ